LSDEQRGRIYEDVMRIADAPVAQAPAPALADALPGGVAMQDLPASVTREFPLVRDHKFVKFDDRIVVVDPASRLVVAMIPRYKLLPSLLSNAPASAASAACRKDCARGERVGFRGSLASGKTAAYHRRRAFSTTQSLHPQGGFCDDDVVLRPGGVLDGRAHRD